MTDDRKGFLGTIGRFFFSPTDPSTLGFMRVMAGLLVLYTHAAYSFDLQAFLGPNAWLNHEVSNRQRREVPNQVNPLDGTEHVPSVRIEDVPHRRAAQLNYLKNLPADPEARKAKLRYLETLAKQPPANNPNQPDPFREGMNLVNSLVQLVGDPSEATRLDKVLASDPFNATDSPISYFPVFLQNLPPAKRLEVWAQIEEFESTLRDAQGQKLDLSDAEYILDWLSQYANDPGPARPRLYLFLTGGLKDGDKDVSLPADPVARQEWIDFVRLWGGDPRQVNAKGQPVFSPWLHLTDPVTMWMYHSACLVVFALFTVGLWTRVTSVMTWALALTYIHRSPIILFGQDTMQTILLTYLMIGPSGAAFSLDALRARYRASRALMGSGRSVAWAEATLAGPQPSWLANFAIRMFQVHFCLIYLSAGAAKLKGPAWWNHTAGWMTLVNPEFGPIRYPVYEAFVRGLTEYRPVISVICAGVVLYTILLQLAFPFLVWTKARPLVVTGSILLHTGIATLMGLCVFSLYMCVLVLAFFPAKLVRARLGVAPGSGRKFTVHYNPTDPVSVRKASAIRAFDVAGQGTYVPGNAGPVSLTLDGHQVTGRDLYAAALREMPLLRPVRVVGFLPGVWPVVKLVLSR
jgi:hypothetical protein